MGNVGIIECSERRDNSESLQLNQQGSFKNSFTVVLFNRPKFHHSSDESLEVRAGIRQLLLVPLREVTQYCLCISDYSALLESYTNPHHRDIPRAPKV